jgi:transposase-like protein
MNVVISGEGGVIADESVYRVPDLLISRKVDGRANYSAQGKARLVEMVRTSGVSLPVLARINEVNANMLAKWVHGWSSSRSAKRALTKSKLMPVVIHESAVKFATAQRSVQCEVVLSRGTLRLSVDAQGLRQVIDALSR